MTLLLDASSPTPQVFGINTNPSVSATFTPPDDALVVVLAATGSNNPSPGLGFTGCVDSNGGTYTVKSTAASAGGYGLAAVFERHYPTSPGPITVAVTTNAQAGQPFPTLTVLVYTGADPDQSSADTTTSTASTSTPTATITATRAGSVAVAAAAGYPLGASGTVLSGTHGLVNRRDAGQILELSGYSTGSAAAVGDSLPVGWSCTAAAPAAVVGVEVLPASDVVVPPDPDECGEEEATVLLIIERDGLDLTLGGDCPTETGLWWNVLQLPQWSMRYTYAPASAYVPGQVLLAAVADAAAVTGVIAARGTGAADVLAQQAILEAALAQFDYTLTITVDGVAIFSAAAQPTLVQWGDVTPQRSGLSVVEGAVSIPVNPLGSP